MYVCVVCVCSKVGLIALTKILARDEVGVFVVKLASCSKVSLMALTKVLAQDEVCVGACVRSVCVVIKCSVCVVIK